MRAGTLAQIVSLWPGRDEYIDHTEAFIQGAPVEPFAARLRQPTPHHLFLSHGVLLALAGSVEIGVEFELQPGGSNPLDLVWEYWDGATWRGFRSTSPECGEQTGQDLDSTHGLTQSGRYVLQADCATAAKTAVNGTDGYWLRARLTQPLPADPNEALPRVDAIRLSSTVDRALRGRIAVGEPQAVAAAKPIFTGMVILSSVPANTSVSGTVTNEAGHPVEGAIVHLIDPADPSHPYSSQPTPRTGEYDIANVTFGREYLFEVTFAGIRFTGPEASLKPKVPPSAVKPSVNLTLSIEGLSPDKAFADATALDASKPFYPLGQQPQPGATFYFTSDEAFTKPGAKVRLYLARTLSPQDEGSISGSQTLEHHVNWEYWNGRQWSPLPVTSNFADSEDRSRSHRSDRLHRAGGHGASQAQRSGGALGARAPAERIVRLQAGDLVQDRHDGRRSPGREHVHVCRRAATGPRLVPDRLHVAVRPVPSRTSAGLQRFPLRGSDRGGGVARHDVRAVRARRGPHARALPGLRQEAASRSVGTVLRRRRGAGRRRWAGAHVGVLGRLRLAPDAGRGRDRLPAAPGHRQRPRASPTTPRLLATACRSTGFGRG